MIYLFVNGSVYDKGGLAMIQGAINGIKTLDDKAEFHVLLPKEHIAPHPDLHFHESPVADVFSIRNADKILDVGGRCHDSPYRRKLVRSARKWKIPYIWMAQSFPPGLNNKSLFINTIPVARGIKSANAIEQVIGARPLVATDLSFLVKPKKYAGTKYEIGFTTHAIKQDFNFEDYIRKEKSVQIIWKPPNGEVWEPELSMPQFTGTVEEMFGLIAGLDILVTARYQAMCAAIISKVKIMRATGGTNYSKYADLLRFREWEPERIKESAMVSCRAAVFTEDYPYVS